MTTEIRAKPNPKDAERGTEYVASIKAEIEEIKSIIAIKDSREWVTIRNIIKRKQVSVDSELDSFHKLSDKELHATLQARIDLKNFVSLVDGGEFALTRLLDKLDKAEGKLSELNKRLGIHGDS